MSEIEKLKQELVTARRNCGNALLAYKIISESYKNMRLENHKLRQELKTLNFLASRQD